MNEVDFSRTKEVIDMLSVIHEGVRDGCLDRCYIKGSGSESVRFVLELAIEYLRAYAVLNVTNTTQVYKIDKGVDVSEVLNMMKTKLNNIYGKSCYIDTDSAKEGDNAQHDNQS